MGRSIRIRCFIDYANIKTDGESTTPPGILTVFGVTGFKNHTCLADSDIFDSRRIFGFYFNIVFTKGLTTFNGEGWGDGI